MTTDQPTNTLTDTEREDLGQRLMLTMTCNHGQDYFGTGAVCETCWTNTQRIGRLFERILAARGGNTDNANERPACECPTDNYCPRCHPRWHALWLARQGSAEDNSLDNPRSLAAALYRLEWDADLYATPRNHVTERYERRAVRLRAALDAAPAPTRVTSVEPGCTCGGIAACQQCQERDAAPAPTGEA